MANPNTQLIGAINQIGSLAVQAVALQQAGTGGTVTSQGNGQYNYAPTHPVPAGAC
jgi:hypothetical protein